MGACGPEMNWSRRSHTMACGSEILCTWGAYVIRKEAWPFYRTIFGVRLSWELEQPEGPKGDGSSC